MARGERGSGRDGVSEKDCEGEVGTSGSSRDGLSGRQSGSGRNGKVGVARMIVWEWHVLWVW